MRLIAKMTLLAFLVPAVVLAAPQTAILDLQNLTCSLCSITVKMALQKVPGVEDAKVNYDAKTVAVRFDDSKANINTLVKATTDAGFPSALRK